VCESSKTKLQKRVFGVSFSGVVLAYGPRFWVF